MPLPPDLSKPVFSIFPEQADRVINAECVFCASPIKDSDFKDEISKREYSISGMCQCCQDEVFSEPEE